jgi:hypothetical protein
MIQKQRNYFSRFIIFISAIHFFSCNKKEDDSKQVNGPCSDFSSPYASNNGPAQMGSTLHLSASSDETNITYEWTGPKNFSSTLQNPDINNISFEAGGIYYARVKNSTCLSNASPTNVIVNSPCSVSDNSGVFGTAVWNFNTAITCGINPSSQYYIKGISINGDLEIRFANENAPSVNKIYGVDNVSLPAFDSTDVQLIINSAGNVFTGQSGTVYVSNYGTISAVFCGIPFKSTTTGTILTGKAKINCL